ncbi:uncharacterized protein [Narcine bancroftii]|uniref:uncharacterized protein n=1 Tax=Narcine bancroftii TaxID=1343680 RepID=UPI00383200F8
MDPMNLADFIALGRSPIGQEMLALECASEAPPKGDRPHHKKSLESACCNFGKKLQWKLRPSPAAGGCWYSEWVGLQSQLPFSPRPERDIPPPTHQENCDTHSPRTCPERHRFASPFKLLLRWGSSGCLAPLDSEPSPLSASLTLVPACRGCTDSMNSPAQQGVYTGQKKNHLECLCDVERKLEPSEEIHMVTRGPSNCAHRRFENENSRSAYSTDISACVLVSPGSQHPNVQQYFQPGFRGVPASSSRSSQSWQRVLKTNRAESTRPQDEQPMLEAFTNCRVLWRGKLNDLIRLMTF